VIAEIKSRTVGGNRRKKRRGVESREEMIERRKGEKIE